MRSLLDAGTAERASVPWRVQPPPAAGALRRDNLTGRGRGILTACRALGHPPRVLGGGGALMTEVAGAVSGPHAPATSLNRQVGPGRRVGVLRLELREVRQQARRSGANLIDVTLDLYAQGLRDLLASRGEKVAGLVRRTSVAVSLPSGREARGLGNRGGGPDGASPRG